MFAQVTTVAFAGIEARAVDVQVQVGQGLPSFTIVGLADKAVAESRERVRSALNAIGLALPAKRITVNLAPADLPKEGSHYDLPIALGLMAASGAIARDALDGYCVIGELALDGGVSHVVNGLPAAVGANALDDPVNALVWLANRCTGRGHTLRAGEVITTGNTAGKPVFARPGDDVRATFGELGEVRVIFA